MKNIFSKKVLLLFIVVSIYTTGVIAASAQDFDIYSADDIFLEAKPEIPGPNEEVSLNLNSYSFNLNNEYITWFKNSERVSSGYGNRKFNFVTGSTGNPTDITAIIEIGNKAYRKEFRFTPASVDLIWEAIDAYAPPFYKGKKMPISQSLIRVTAVPETQLLAPKDAPNLVYYWDNNYRRDVDGSGFGKPGYDFIANPINEEERITVTTNDRRENSFATNTVLIPVNTHKVETLFYEINNNDRLLTNRALNNFGTTTNSQIKLAFHPLNISSVLENFVDLFVVWNLNGTPQPPQNFSKQNELFIAPLNDTGSVSINVTTENIEKINQKHKESLQIIFSQ